jgi:hypothetical protein
VRMNAQYQEIPYQGVTLHRWLNQDEKKGPSADQLMYGYIHKGQEVAIGIGLDALKAAVDTLKGPGTAASTGLLSQVPQSESGTFLQIAATNIGEIVGQDSQAAMLQQAESLSLTAGEAAEKVFIGLRLQGQSPEVAENILKMAQGVVAMAQLATQEQPKLSELAKNVNVARDDKTVRVRFEAPAQSVAAFLKEQWAKENQPYEIARVEDVSFSNVKRYAVRVRVDKVLSRDELQAVSEKVVKELRETRPHNAVTIFYFLRESDLRGAYTAGKAEWAPYGEWARAGDVQTGDYAQHKLKLFPGNATGINVEEATVPGLSIDLKKKIFFDVVAAQDRGASASEAHALIAEQYNLTKDIVDKIAWEGTAKGWPTP